MIDTPFISLPALTILGPAEDRCSSTIPQGTTAGSQEMGSDFHCLTR